MKISNKSYINSYLCGLLSFTMLLMSCHDRLDLPNENTQLADETEITSPDNVILPLIGMYAEFYSRGWEGIPLIAVRGDDVNSGGIGDQQDFAEADRYNYNQSYWMFNSLWEVFYSDIYNGETAIQQIRAYKDVVPNPAIIDQYIGEVRVMQSFLLFQLSRVWGDLLVPETSSPTDLFQARLTPKNEIMQMISDSMDKYLPVLPNVHPANRSDIPGGVTRYTALAIKALANLEMKNYQAVANATSEIINSGTFSLFPDFYNLFKIPGKLCSENILELQYSDYGASSGPANNYLNDFYGPTSSSYKTKVPGASGGWGFFEPSIKWIKFMLDRGEETRLVTSVLFTPDGIAQIQSDPNYSTLPPYVSNITPSGDTLLNFARAIFSSGKHYLPSDQLTPGRTAYASNKNMTCIRYAEILLMYAEALTQGASGGSMTATEAVNAVRMRAGLPPLANVTLQDVKDEKFAELAMEWGVRYYDVLRWEDYSELSYDGRTFTPDKAYLPYPQNQVDQLPALQP